MNFYSEIQVGTLYLQRRGGLVVTLLSYWQVKVFLRWIWRCTAWWSMAQRGALYCSFAFWLCL